MTILFLKRLNDTFEENAEKLIQQGKEAYENPNRHNFFIRNNARWSVLASTSENIGEKIDHVCRIIERENPSPLDGVLTNTKYNDKRKYPDDTFVFYVYLIMGAITSCIINIISLVLDTRILSRRCKITENCLGNGKYNFGFRPLYLDKNYLQDKYNCAQREQKVRDKVLDKVSNSVKRILSSQYILECEFHGRANFSGADLYVEYL